jgi:DNA-directed RNA polymerase alpha subunit
MKQNIIFQFSSFSKEDQKIIKKIVDKRLIECGKNPEILSIKITCFSKHFIAVEDLDISVRLNNFLKSFKISTLEQLISAYNAGHFRSDKISIKSQYEIEEVMKEHYFE